MDEVKGQLLFSDYCVAGKLCHFTKDISYLRWLSVSVIPCDVTLNWTTVAEGRGLRPREASVALAIAWGPVRDSVSTEFR